MDETEVLLQFLDMERNHILGIFKGFSEEQLRRPVLPSGWNCLGLVRHLALADEHYWFLSVVGGESFGFFPRGHTAEWQLDPGEAAEDVFNLYRDEIEHSNAIIIIIIIIAATPLDMAPRQRDPHLRRMRQEVLRPQGGHASRAQGDRLPRWPPRRGERTPRRSPVDRPQRPLAAA